MGRFKDIINEKYDISSTNEEIEKSFEEYLSTREKIDEEFCRLTKLDKTDLSFLLFASILQTARWVIFNKPLGDKIDEKNRVDHNDSDTKNSIKEEQNKYKNKNLNEKNSVKKSEIKGCRTWIEIAMTTKVPYDATRNSAAFGLKMEGKYHRIHTLGHDPILGYIFGTFNILTGTMTLPNLRSFDIKMEGLEIENETTIFDVFSRGFSSIKEDKLRLPAAIFAQTLHLKSDEYTKTGLPIPFLSVFDEKLAGKVYKDGYDKLCFYRDIKNVGTQVVFSTIINMIIALIHGLYYDENKYKNRDLYEVKTRKILLYSNILASSGNLLYTTFTKNYKSLDIGEFLVTAYRIISDVSFMRKVEKEFIDNKLYEKYSSEINELDKEIKNSLEFLNLTL